MILVLAEAVRSTNSAAVENNISLKICKQMYEIKFKKACASILHALFLGAIISLAKEGKHENSNRICK